MPKPLAQEVAAFGLLNKGEGIVVGVSGGSDSMALLHVLMQLSGPLEWRFKLHVAHLNHGLRGEEAIADAAFVQAACDGLSIPCTIDHRDIGGSAASEGLSIEEMSRRERYAFFERVCLQTGIRTVALAHHADDNAETILHRVLRGTGLRGLAGIPRSRPLSQGSQIRVIRPLLSFTKADLRAYLEDAGIIYREDISNTSNEPMRNRIRNVILPQVETLINPQVRDALTRLGQQARWLDEFLGETIQRTFETLVVNRTDRTLVMNADAVLRKSRIIQAELIRTAYTSFGLGEQDLSFSHMAAVLDILADPASGRQIQLPGGVVVEKRYRQLTFSLPTSESRETIAAEIAVHLPGKTLLPVRRLEIDCQFEEAAQSDIHRLRRMAGRMEEFVDMDAVRPPLVVRSRRPGDRFVPLGAPGSKKLADFLADEKVEPRDRELVAVLCDQLGPIWVIGHRIDDRVKLTELTRQILHLRARRLEK